MKDAGFDNMEEKKIENRVEYNSPDHYWIMMNEVAAPVVAAMSQADHDTKTKIKNDLFQLLEEKKDKGALSLPFAAIIIYGEK
ncbi:MAG: hypothetical protein WDO71_26985 [Bacteroidota bacterium]